MTTIPMPLFIVLCILAVPTVWGFVVLGFVVYRMVRLAQEEQQREKRENEKAVEWVEIYLHKIGGKKWNMH